MPVADTEMLGKLREQDPLFTLSVGKFRGGGGVRRLLLTASGLLYIVEYR
jgi:hypothetical protein